MRKRREELEEEIARCEAEISAYELELANFKSAQESIRVAALIDERRTHLKQMMKEWEATRRPRWKNRLFRSNQRIPSTEISL